MIPKRERLRITKKYKQLYDRADDLNNEIELFMNDLAAFMEKHGLDAGPEFWFPEDYKKEPKPLKEVRHG